MPLPLKPMALGPRRSNSPTHNSTMPIRIAVGRNISKSPTWGRGGGPLARLGSACMTWNVWIM